MIKSLVVATGNPGKLKEMQDYLTSVKVALQLKPPELDIEETGDTFLSNAELKAGQIALATQQWSIADDSGLAIPSLNGAPGLYSARYGMTDQDRIDRVLRELAPYEDRTARFICAIAIARPDGSIAWTTEGICEGKITHETRGEKGFGYDPIFYVPSMGKTFSEMTPEEKKQVSHRGEAFKHLLAQWQTIQ